MKREEIRAEDFVHLHVHSDNSILDGACSVGDLVNKAVKCKHKALALTDHGNISGALEFYKKAKEKDVKPIVGCEAYLFDGPMDSKIRGYNHITLLAQNETGYRNISKLSSLGFLKGFYYKPRINWETMAEHSEGIICLSGCLKGAISDPILKEDFKLAKELAGRMNDIFRDRFFLEIQSTPIEKQYLVNDGCIRLSRQLEIPLAATCDVHYINPEDAVIQDIKICIGSGKKRDDTNRLRIKEGIYYRNTQEMIDVFGHIPEAITNTRRIADMVDFTFPTVSETGKYYLPKFDCPNSYSEEEYFDILCEKGIKKRYRDNITDTHRKRLEYEKKVIKDLGYVSYFLVVQDFIGWAKNRDIPVGPSRGSAGGCIVSYCLGITDIDPIKYNLLFERFLNPSRVSMPDIDIDFCQHRRGEVIDYVRNKYGHESVCQIITFGTLGAKATVKDVWRVEGIDHKESDMISKSIPEGPKVSLASYKRTQAYEKLIASDQRRQELFSYCERLEGLKRHHGVHAAGVVIGDTNLLERIPVQHVKKQYTTQLAMQEVEEVGLLKMDFLGLRTLTVIHKTEQLISKKLGRKFVVSEDADLEDAETYKMIATGNTKGVFQIEQKGFQEVIKKVKPDRFEDLAALVALYRPGPLGSGMDETYANCKHGRQEITYLHPTLEPILNTTYGGILYQEQVTQIANQCAGFSMAEADVLRMAVGKKKEYLMQKMKPQFLEGCQQVAGMDSRVAQELWDQIAYFAEYGFNRAHSCGYALLTFYTGWLKQHYPVEYMAATLSSWATAKLIKFIPYINECRRLGIKILPPDIQKSDLDFTVDENGSIVYGLLALKGVGAKAASSIVEQRNSLPDKKYKSLHHFCEKVDTSKVSNAVVEKLIQGGAFDSLGHRSQLLAIKDEAVNFGKSKKKNVKQGGLFDVMEEEMIEELDSLKVPDTKPYTPEEIQKIEKELLGFYLSSHPLDAYRDLIAEIATHDSGDLVEDDEEESPENNATQIIDGQNVIVGGYVTNLKIHTQKNNKSMAFLTITDLIGPIESVVFASVFEDIKETLRLGSKIFIEGRIQFRDERLNLIAENIIPFEFASKLKRKKPTQRTPSKREEAADDFENALGVEFPKKDRVKPPASIEKKPEREKDEKKTSVSYKHDEKIEQTRPTTTPTKAKAAPRETDSGEDRMASAPKKVDFEKLKNELKKKQEESYLVYFELSTRWTTQEMISEMKNLFKDYPGPDIVRYRFKEYPDNTYEMEDTVFASRSFEDKLYDILGRRGNITVRKAFK